MNFKEIKTFNLIAHKLDHIQKVAFQNKKKI